MTKPWTERLHAEAVKNQVENQAYYDSDGIDAVDLFTVGAQFGYEQGLAEGSKGRLWRDDEVQKIIAEIRSDLGKMTALNKGHAQAYLQQCEKRIELETQLENAKAESPPSAQIDETKWYASLAQAGSDLADDYPDVEGYAIMDAFDAGAKWAWMRVRNAAPSLTLTAESEIPEFAKTKEFLILSNKLFEADKRIAELEAERDSWKWEYENVCKFATQYETERDELKVEVAHFKTMEAEWDALETLHAERKALTAKLQKAKDWFHKIHENEYPDLMVGTYMKWREQAREALKELEGE